MLTDPRIARYDLLAASRGYAYSPSLAERPVRWIEANCVHVSGRWQGEPLRLLPWAADMLRRLFGWVKRADPRIRRYTDAWVEVPKKNAKSTTAAAVGLYMLRGDGEKGAKVCSLATSLEQSDEIHDTAIEMVTRSPELARQLYVNRTRRTIRDVAEHGMFNALAADAMGREGLNTSCFLLDEIHVWTDRTVLDALEYASIARLRPLRLMLTTAGVEDPESLGYQLHQEAVAVLEGENPDIHRLVLIYAADRDDDPASPKTWAKANPAMGTIIREEEIAEACSKAIRVPRKMRLFRRYRLNQWTSDDGLWIEPDDWAACRVPELAGPGEWDQCWAGLDLSSTNDMAAVALIWQLPDGRVACRLKYYAPEDRLLAWPALARWVDAGLVTICGIRTMDYEVIRADCEALGFAHPVRGMAFDPWQGGYLSQQIGLAGIPTTKFIQSPRHYHGPVTQFESMVIDRKIAHDGNAVLSYNLRNVRLVSDRAGHAMPSKRTSIGRIDGLTALLMALWLYLGMPIAFGSDLPGSVPGNPAGQGAGPKP